jgi:hypothetical protein
MAFRDTDIALFVAEVVGNGTLDAEIEKTQRSMIWLTKNPIGATKEENAINIVRYTQIFKGLLTEKARQESVQQMSEYNRRNAENPSTRPTDDTRPRISIGNILE